jgi:sugar phosphate isomerase/epimerase
MIFNKKETPFKMDRRKFTKNAALGLLGLQTLSSLGAEKLFFKTSRIPLGLCNHSLKSLKLNGKQLLQHAIDNKFDSVLFNSISIFKSLEAEYLTQIKNLADKNNISLYIGVGSISEKSKLFRDTYGTPKEKLIEGIRVAKLLGSPTVSCMIGSTYDRYAVGGIRPHMDSVIKVMQSVRKEVLEAGIKIAFENHAGDLRNDEVIEVVEKSGTDIVGILFDPANSVWALENPMESLELFKNYIVCTSIRDIEVWETETGAAYQCKAVGEGMLDFKKYVKVISKSCPGLPLHIETISNSPKDLPFETSDFMKGFPEVSERDLNKFRKFASKGEVQEVVTPEKKDKASKKAFKIKLEKEELQKSIDYLRKNCDVGLKL